MANVRTNYIQSRRVREITATITYADNGTTVNLCEIPAGGRVISIIPNVKVGLDVAPLVDIGTPDDADYFAAAVDMSLVGVASLIALHPGENLHNPTVITATVGAANTAGECALTILFSHEKDTNQ